MLPPVLEIYVAWHPSDKDAAAIASVLSHHFHGGCFATMLGGAVEVYVRSMGWRSEDDAPRPIDWPGRGHTGPGRVQPAQCVAVVPIIGMGMLRAVQQQGPWSSWLSEAFEAQATDPGHVKVLPMRLPGILLQGRLAAMMPSIQMLAEPDPLLPEASRPPMEELRQLDLVQALAQWLSPAEHDRLRVFVSHTKRLNDAKEPVKELVEAVFEVLKKGRIGSFYDAQDLQPGGDWKADLNTQAGTCALLALRTDLYASRDWCQREVLRAKRQGMPVVMIDALSAGEARGSFLMDHVPRIPARRHSDGTWDEAVLRLAIAKLADAWLHRALWERQSALAQMTPPYDGFRWLPVAPEPSTLVQHLTTARDEGTLQSLRILHPDPPLASQEHLVLQELAALAGMTTSIDFATPRLLAARGA